MAAGKKKPVVKNTDTPGIVRSLRDNAEEQLARSPKRSPNLTGQKAGELIHELQVHQIELETQNETLRQTQTALEESRDRYVDLYEFAPVGYLTLTAAGLIAEINLTGATLLGEDRQKLLRRRFAHFIAPGDEGRWQGLFIGVLQEQGRQSCELSMLRKDDSRFHARLDCVRREGEAPCVRVTLIDITALKRAEEEMRIAAITFESQEGMIVTDPHGVIVRVNRAFTRLTASKPPRRSDTRPPCSSPDATIRSSTSRCGRR